VSTVLSPDLDSRTFTWCVRPLHKHRRIITSHNLVTEIKKKRTRSKSGKQIAFHQQMTSIITLCLSIPPLTQEPSPCLRLNPKSIWWLAGGYKQGWKLTGSTGFAFSKSNVSGSAAGSRPDMVVFDCGFTEPSRIWLLPGREVPCGICNIPETMSSLSISSPNVVGGGAEASSSVWGWTTTGTLNWVVPYFLSR